MKSIILSSVMKYGIENDVDCAHDWGNANDAGVSKCSECGRESVFRTTVPVNIVSDYSVNARLTELGKGHSEVYNKVLMILAAEYEDAYASAVADCDDHAKNQGMETFLPFSSNLSYHLTSTYDLNNQLSEWRERGEVDRKISSHVQLADIRQARQAFLQKYAAMRDGIMAIRKLVEKNQEVRDHNANLGENDSKKSIKHPKRKDHRKAAIDMSDVRNMLRETEETDALYFSNVAVAEIRGEERNLIKIMGVPEFMINRYIPEGLEVRTAYFKERTKHIRENMDSSRRLWEVSFAVRCMIPEKQHISDEEEYVISADTGSKNHIATSEGERWSVPGRKQSFRKTKVLQQQADTMFKNGSRKHKKISQKNKKETEKRTRTAKSCKQEKAAELVKKADTIVLENLNHEAMKLSAKGTKAQPGKNVAAKRGLNRALQTGAMGQTQTLIQHASQNANKSTVFVYPQYTSQRCIECGNIDENNRKGEVFICTDENCDYEGHADTTATHNMLKIYKGGKGSIKPKGGKAVVPTRIKKGEKASLISMSTAPAPRAGNPADIDQIQANMSKDRPAVPAKNSRRSDQNRRRAYEKETLPV